MGAGLCVDIYRGAARGEERWQGRRVSCGDVCEAEVGGVDLGGLEAEELGWVLAILVASGWVGLGLL